MEHLDVIAKSIFAWPQRSTLLPELALQRREAALHHGVVADGRGCISGVRFAAHRCRPPH